MPFSAFLHLAFYPEIVIWIHLKSSKFQVFCRFQASVLTKNVLQDIHQSSPNLISVTPPLK